MMTTLCAIVGLVFLVLTNLASIISFATPYWIVEGQRNRGLWAFCEGQTCTWVFQTHHGLPEQGSRKHVDISSSWWLATQGLMSVGLGLSLFALLVATIALCCECKRCNSSHAVSGLLMLAFLSTLVAVVVFGVCCDLKLGVSIDTMHHFAWSFWLAAAAAGLSLLSAIVYACESRARYHYSNAC
ncbi:uncharacterized protein LOC143290953 [Babylonia areolata]|uniref:uncharacterized protein LOC143290953 n=1 Tax=Babylonia areolata TaxID=304850 RepID=UPI003FD58417